MDHRLEQGCSAGRGILPSQQVPGKSVIKRGELNSKGGRQADEKKRIVASQRHILLIIHALFH